MKARRRAYKDDKVILMEVSWLAGGLECVVPKNWCTAFFPPNEIFVVCRLILLLALSDFMHGSRSLSTAADVVPIPLQARRLPFHDIANAERLQIYALNR